MSEATAEPRLLNTTEAAGRLGVSRRYLYDLINSGEIATVRLPSGGTKPEHRIEESEIEAFIERHRQPATP